MNDCEPEHRLSFGVLRDPLVATLAAVAVWRLVLTVLEAPRHTFAETRLMPLFLALGGQAPYAMPGDGACYLPMYPPLSILFFAPVTLFHDPVGVLRAGASLTLVAALLPMALFLVLTAPGEGVARRRALAMVAFVFFVHISPVLVTLVFIHADTPSIAVVGVGAFLVALSSRRDSLPLLVLASVVLSLAPWTKHTLLPAVLLPALAAASSGRWRGAVAQLGLGAGLQALWTGLFALLFGGERLFFWLVDFPGRHPWLGEPFEILALSNRLLLSIVLVELAVLVGAWITLRHTNDLSRNWSLHPWAVLFVTALLLWPSSLVGYVKVGGALNSFLPTTYFLACALLVLLVEGTGGGTFAAIPRLGSGILLFTASVLGIQVAAESATDTRTVARATYESSIAYQTLRNNPDQYLFPWFPMSTYLATGRFAHSELGLQERGLGGIAVPPEQFRRFVPSGLRYVACGKDPCPSTLGRLQILDERTVTGPSGRWTIREVSMLPSR